MVTEEPHFAHHIFDGGTLRNTSYGKSWKLKKIIQKCNELSIQILPLILIKPAQIARITTPRFQHWGIPKQSFVLWC